LNPANIILNYVHGPEFQELSPSKVTVPLNLDVISKLFNLIKKKKYKNQIKDIKIVKLFDYLKIYMHNFKIKTKNINHITTLYFNLDSFLLFLLIIINYVNNNSLSKFKTKKR
jgi:hypothetical protein